MQFFPERGDVYRSEVQANSVLNISPSYDQQDLSASAPNDALLEGSSVQQFDEGIQNFLTETCRGTASLQPFN